MENPPLRPPDTWHIGCSQRAISNRRLPVSVSGVQPNLWFLPWNASAQSQSTATLSLQGGFDLTSVLTGNAAASTNATTSATTSTSVTPDQKLAADLQTLLNDLQSAAPPATTANADPTDGTGQVRPHHHHHHHEGGGEASGATGVAANTSGAPGATQDSSGQTGGPASAADILLALQAYGGAASSLTG
jgi:hypothetical protein